MPAGFYSLQVAKINRETKDAVSITFDVPTHLSSQFQYKAGQYLTFSIVINGEEVRRSYSVCSSPVTNPSPTIAVKQVENGRMSTFLNNELKEGDSIEVMPPMGKFILEPNASASNNYFLFGGGSGITPLLSIIKTALLTEPNSKCYLFYANTDIDSIIFRDELKALEADNSNFKVFYSLDHAPADWNGYTGFLSEGRVSEIIRNELGLNYPTAQYYTCGPSAMMKVVEDGLKSTGVQDDNISVEYFTAVTKTSDTATSDADEPLDSEEVIERSIKVEVFGTTKEVTVKPDETILIAAQDAGLDPPYSCTVGVCTTCRARLRTGRASMDEREGLSDAEIDLGYVLTCQAHPLTDDVDLVYE
jgi:ring-1,2-phenylacetyl-CoA epoxidase subunit PaaE